MCPAAEAHRGVGFQEDRRRGRLSTTLASVARLTGPSTPLSAQEKVRKKSFVS